VTTCPRCSATVANGQEYCVECGLRLPGGGVAGSPAVAGRGWARRALLALVVAAAGAAAAVAAAGGGKGGSTNLITATGGFASVPAVNTIPGPAGSTGAGGWPATTSGWTIVLLSVPQTAGQKDAIAMVGRARKAGLPGAGILDSSAFASLHPGYWVVFSGVYTSQAEATSALQPAQELTRAATVRRVVP